MSAFIERMSAMLCWCMLLFVSHGSECLPSLSGCLPCFISVLVFVSHGTECPPSLSGCLPCCVGVC